MKNQKGSILPILIFLVLVVVGGGYLILGKNNSQDLLNQAKQIVTKDQSGGKTEVTPTEQAQISITKDGFLPTSITVAKNQSVIWINKDSTSHDLSMPEFEKETLNPGDSFTYIFEKTGSFSYADELDPDKYRGIVIVE